MARTTQLQLQQQPELLHDEDDEGSFADDEDLQATALCKRRSKRASSAMKRNLARRGRLPVAPAGQHGDEQHLRSCLALLEKLPKQSAWARHRRLVLSKVITLLRLSRRQRTTEQASELTSLLRHLNISAAATSIADAKAAKHGGAPAALRAGGGQQ